MKPRTSGGTAAEAIADNPPHDDTLHSKESGGSGGLKFLREFILHPTSVGAIAPSSPGLARRMVEGLDLARARAVVEYGPGTGVFTEQILARIGPGTTFITIERNPELARLLRRHHPALPNFTVCEDSAENVESICARHGIDPAGRGGGVDYVISGLPYLSFPQPVTDAILAATARVLKPGGAFRTFSYHCCLWMPSVWRFRRTARSLFSSVRTGNSVWRNLPPAYIYHCVK